MAAQQLFPERIGVSQNRTKSYCWYPSKLDFVDDFAASFGYGEVQTKTECIVPQGVLFN